MLKEAVKALKAHIRGQRKELATNESALAKLTGGATKRRKRRAGKGKAAAPKPTKAAKKSKKKPAADEAEKIRKEIGLDKDKE